MMAYGVGPRMLRLQKQFWDTAKLMYRAGGNYGEPFNTKRVVTQVGPLSFLMFNVCVDAMVREWLCQMLDEDAVRDGIGNQVAEILVVFYVDNGRIASRDPVWLQESFNILFGLFEHKSVCSQMHPRQKSWYASQDGYARPTQRQEQ